MIKKTYIIRHAEPYFDFGEVTVLGRNSDPLLSQEGKKSAREFAYAFAETAKKAGVIYTSPLKRAKMTAFEIAMAAGVQLNAISSLVEMDAGEWDGKTLTEIEDQYPELYARRQEDMSIAPPGGEKFPYAAKRAEAAVTTIAAMSPSDTVVIVSHATLTRALLCKLMDIPYKENRTIPQDYLAVNMLEYDTETNQLTVSEA